MEIVNIYIGGTRVACIASNAVPTISRNVPIICNEFGDFISLYEGIKCCCATSPFPEVVNIKSVIYSQMKRQLVITLNGRISLNTIENIASLLGIKGSFPFISANEHGEVECVIPIESETDE